MWVCEYRNYGVQGAVMPLPVEIQHHAPRVVSSDFRMGGDLSPPHWGGTKVRWGGDWRVIRDKAVEKFRLSNVKKEGIC